MTRREQVEQLQKIETALRDELATKGGRGVLLAEAIDAVFRAREILAEQGV